MHAYVVHGRGVTGMSCQTEAGRHVQRQVCISIGDQRRAGMSRDVNGRADSGVCVERVRVCLPLPCDGVCLRKRAYRFLGIGNPARCAATASTKER